MAYSVMLWLVNPGEQQFEAKAVEQVRSSHHPPGAHQGVNMPPAATRLVYGVYNKVSSARRALERIGKRLAVGRPIEIELHGGISFLIPAQRVHYAVLSEAMRPKDQEPPETTPM